jgi:hypothetical protein
MTGKPSGIMERRRRRKLEHQLRLERCEKLKFDIGVLQRIIDQSELHEQPKLKVKLRTLQQRLRYINKAT